MLAGEFRTRQDAPLNTKGFREGAEFEFHLPVDVEMVHDAPATFTEDAFAVTIVDHDHGIMLFGQGHDLVQRRDVTVHGEDAIGDDELPFRTLVGNQHLFQRAHVVVRIHRTTGLGEANAVDDRTVVQLVADDQVLRTTDEAWDHPTFAV